MNVTFDQLGHFSGCPALPIYDAQENTMVMRATGRMFEARPDGDRVEVPTYPLTPQVFRGIIEALAAVEDGRAAIVVELSDGTVGLMTYKDPEVNGTGKSFGRQVMPKVGGVGFRCGCGCNVFTEYEKLRYRCNACKAEYAGENAPDKAVLVSDLSDETKAELLTNGFKDRSKTPVTDAFREWDKTASKEARQLFCDAANRVATILSENAVDVPPEVHREVSSHPWDFVDDANR